MLSVKQKQDESLKNYIIYFNKETVRVENYIDVAALTIIITRLWPRRFYYSLTKNALEAFIELLLRAQKYSNADELIQIDE